MPIRVRRLPSNVEAERAKGRRGVLLSTFPTAGRAGIPVEKAQKFAKKRIASEHERRSPARAVKGRFHALSECTAEGNRSEDYHFERRLDEALRRARRLDEQIVRTVAASTSGRLAQLRLLSAFYDESTNGIGRRGALLIQIIAAGIERLDAAGPGISPEATANAVDRIHPTHRENDGDESFAQVAGSQGNRHPQMPLPLQPTGRCL
jgi:hypothetical protein